MPVNEGLVCVCDTGGSSREEEADEEIDNGIACSEAEDIVGSTGISFGECNTCSPPESSVPSSRRIALESSRSSSDLVKASVVCER